MKVVYVSDNIGCPIHMRGIFHYSANMIKLLSSQGHEVDIVLQYPNGINKEALEFDYSQNELSEVVKSSIIAEYLFNSGGQQGAAHFKKALPSLKVKNILNSLLNLEWIWLLRHIIPLSFEKPCVVVNKFNQLDYIPLSHVFFKGIRNILLFGKVYYQKSFLPPKKIDLRGYDLIVLDAPHYFNILKSPGTEVLSIIHDLLPFTDPHLHTKQRSTFRKKMNATLNMATKMIFVSKTTQQSFEQYYTLRRPSAIIYPIFSPQITLADLVTDAFTQLKSLELHKEQTLKASVNTHEIISKRSITITTVVSDENRKNIQAIIDAHQLLPNNYKLNIIGSINHRNYIVSSEQKRRVTFSGYVSDTNKVKMLHSSDVVCYPSLAEGFGIPIIEGIYYTGRVVCSDIPIFREIIDGYAHFCNPMSAWDIADKILFACSLPKLDNLTREQALEAYSCASQSATLERLLHVISE